MMVGGVAASVADSVALGPVNPMTRGMRLSERWRQRPFSTIPADNVGGTRAHKGLQIHH